MSLGEILEKMNDEGFFERIAINPVAQFGSTELPYMLARYLPESLQQSNSFTERSIKHLRIPAISGNPYSPAQQQAGGSFAGSMFVDLGNIETKRQMSSAEADETQAFINSGSDERAQMVIEDWVARELVTPVLDRNEIQRAEALLDASVVRQTTDGVMDPVAYFRPGTHYVEVSGGTTGSPAGWYDNTYDPMTDINLGVRTLTDKGFPVIAMIGSSPLESVLAENGEIIKRSSLVTIDAGQVTAINNFITTPQLNQIFLSLFRVPLEIYNNGYHDSNGYRQFMDLDPGVGDYMILIGRSRRQWDLVRDFLGPTTGGLDGFQEGVFDGNITIENTLGYFGIGRNAGMEPGRTISSQALTQKPWGLIGEAVEMGLPVPLVPDAYYVIKVLRPT